MESNDEEFDIKDVFSYLSRIVNIIFNFSYKNVILISFLVIIITGGLFYSISKKESMFTSIATIKSNIVDVHIAEVLIDEYRLQLEENKGRGDSVFREVEFIPFEDLKNEKEDEIDVFKLEILVSKEGKSIDVQNDVLNFLKSNKYVSEMFVSDVRAKQELLNSLTQEIEYLDTLQNLALNSKGEISVITGLSNGLSNQKVELIKEKIEIQERLKKYSSFEIINPVINKTTPDKRSNIKEFLVAFLLFSFFFLIFFSLRSRVKWIKDI